MAWRGTGGLRGLFVGVFVLVALHACGGDDEGSVDERDDASAADGGSEDDGGPSGVGGRGMEDGGSSQDGATGSGGLEGGTDSGANGGWRGDATASGGDGNAPECSAEDDTCPDGEYCAGDTCIAGCKNDGACGSGVCEPSRDCAPCVTDLECAAGRVCGTGVCSDPCAVEDGAGTEEGAGSGCGAGLSCCSGRCVDTELDIDHCGDCGAACEANEFCGVTGCADAVLANLCDNERAIGLLTGEMDDTATRAILAELGGCVDSTSEVAQETADAINSNPETDTLGRPLTRGADLLVAAGGSFYQRVVAYLEATRIAPLYAAQVAGPAYEIRTSSDDSVIVELAESQLNAQHDIAIIELARAPDTGSLVLIAQGFYVPGTAAAGWYLANVMLPSLETFDESWYVYEWQDDGTDGPSDPAEFTRRQ